MTIRQSQPATNKIADWVIEELTVDYERLLTVCVRVLRARLNGWSSDEIDDLAEKEEEKYLPEYLRDLYANRIDDGGTVNFEIDDAQQPYIRRTNNELINLSDRLRKIDWKIFENLCAEILKKLGGDSKVSGQSGDGGVDFYATGIKTHTMQLPLPRNAALCVIGQAKRYQNSYVTETELRVFVGGAILKLEELKRSNSLGLLGPTIFAFWTSSTLHSNAKKFAKSMGIWYMDGFTFAQYIKVLDLEHLLIDSEPSIIISSKNAIINVAS
jgi:restriction endonuclease Mrr